MQFQKGLILKYDEPFEVVKKINVVAYELKLLESLISLYPSFHVSFLKPYYKDPDIWKQFNCEIACILKHMKMRNWKKKWIEFLVHKKMMLESETSWEKETTLWQFKDLVKEYLHTMLIKTLTPLGGRGVC